MKAEHSSVLDAGIRAALPLTEVGFIYSGVREAETDALGQYLEATFTHPRTGRRIDIAYMPEPNDLGGKPALSVHVEKNNRDTHSGIFSIDDFLKHRGADSKALAALSLRSYEGSRLDQVKGVLAHVAMILNSDLKDVVAGSEWVEVPMDWGDYR